MNTDNKHRPLDHADKMVEGHPVVANIVIIVVVAVLGLVIAYLGLGIFTKHGQTDTVPTVVNMSYSGAVEKLHEAGFKVEIRDSLFLENVKPGYVVEQFPSAGAVVKPGRKIFLYINAVHPKEVILDPMGDSRQPALRGYSLRQAKAQLEEMGFKNIRISYVLGDTDRVVKVLANGKPVMKQQKIPVNAQILLEVYDGRMTELTDSLQNAEVEMELRIQRAREAYQSEPDAEQAESGDEFENEAEPSVPENSITE